MSEKPVVWALLAPAPATWVQKKVDAFWKPRVDHAKHPEKWQIVEGTGAYSAVLNRNPGTDQTYEIPLAKMLSRELSEPVYVLYPIDAYEEVNSISVYQNGRETGSLPDDLYWLASSLGVSLPGAPQAKAKLRIRSVVLVEGVSAEAAARAFGFETPPRSKSLSVEDGLHGALVYSSLVGDLTTLAYELSGAFADQVVYVLSVGPTPERFLVRVMRGGNTEGAFDFPNPVTFTTGGTPKIRSVKGETTPDRIASALGVPPDLLKLSQHS